MIDSLLGSPGGAVSSVVEFWGRPGRPNENDPDAGPAGKQRRSSATDPCRPARSEINEQSSPFLRKKSSPG